jgi:hypothetical protein
VPNHLFPIRFKSKLPSGGVQHIMPIGNYQHEVGLYCLCQMGLQKTANGIANDSGKLGVKFKHALH